MTKKIIIIFMTGIGCLAMMAATVIFIDSEAPTITITDTTPIEMSCELNRTQALKGVSATDNKDGDLTSSIFIEEQREKFIVQNGELTYVVVDDAGNVSKQTKSVVTDDFYDKRVIENNLPLNFVMGGKIDLTEYFTLVDGCGNIVKDELTLQIFDTEKDKELVLVVSDSNKIAEEVKVNIEIIDYDTPIFRFSKVETNHLEYAQFNYYDNNNEKYLSDSISIKGNIISNREDEAYNTITEGGGA